MSDVAPANTAMHGIQQEPLTATLQQHSQTIQQVQSSLSSISYNTQYTDQLQIYRFLKGYKFNVQQTVEALQTSLQMRRQHSIDKIRQHIVDNFDTITQSSLPHASAVSSAFPHVIIHGYDRQNQPISIEQIGLTNLPLLIKVVSLDQFLEYQMWHTEYKAEMCKRLSYKYDRVIRTAKIMDLTGLSRAHLNRTGLSYLRAVITTAQQLHPELLGRLYIVNAGAVFRLCWSMVKPMLNENTLSKIEILGDSKQYQPVILRDVDKSTLPTQYGGTCSKCPHGCVPRTEPDAGFTRVTVNKGSKHTCTADVTTEQVGTTGAIISYNFRTEKHNLGMHYTYKSADGTCDVNTESQKYDSDKQTVSGTVDVNAAGVLTMTFDNTFSRFTSKTLLYQLSVDSNNQLVYTTSSAYAHKATDTDALRSQNGLLCMITFHLL